MTFSEVYGPGWLWWFRHGLRAAPGTAGFAGFVDNSIYRANEQNMEFCVTVALFPGLIGGMIGAASGGRRAADPRSIRRRPHVRNRNTAHAPPGVVPTGLVRETVAGLQRADAGRERVRRCSGGRSGRRDRTPVQSTRRYQIAGADWISHCNSSNRGVHPARSRTVAGT